MNEINDMKQVQLNLKNIILTHLIDILTNNGDMESVEKFLYEMYDIDELKAFCFTFPNGEDFLHDYDTDENEL